jgi:hypothetical protein
MYVILESSNQIDKRYVDATIAHDYIMGTGYDA